MMIRISRAKIKPGKLSEWQDKIEKLSILPVSDMS